MANGNQAINASRQARPNQIQKTAKSLERGVGNKSPIKGLVPSSSHIANQQHQQMLRKNRHQAQSLKSLLTVTVIEAELKVDLSSFMQKMSVYCKVVLQS
jgi:hypothetical protein